MSHAVRVRQLKRLARFGFLTEMTVNSLNDIAKKLIRRLADLSPSCKAATRLQSEAFDHKLAFRQRLGLRIHLLFCKWCRRYGKQIAFVSHAAHSHSDEMATSAPHRLSAEARERIRQKLRVNET